MAFSEHHDQTMKYSKVSSATSGMSIKVKVQATQVAPGMALCFNNVPDHSLAVVTSAGTTATNVRLQQMLNSFLLYQDTYTRGNQGFYKCKNLSSKKNSRLTLVMRYFSRRNEFAKRPSLMFLFYVLMYIFMHEEFYERRAR